MGQYFKFVNLLTGELSELPLLDNEGCFWQVDLLAMDPEEILRNLRIVAYGNLWDLEETAAIGDYGTVLNIDPQQGLQASHVSDWSGSPQMALFQAFDFSS